MKIYDIINPSDAVTIEANDPIVAAVSILLLGDGQYALDDEEGHAAAPFFMFGGLEQWLREKGIDSLDKYFKLHASDIAEVLRSCVYGSITDRRSYNIAISHIPEGEREVFRDRWNEARRSSITNIVKRGDELAKALTSKYKASGEPR